MELTKVLKSLENKPYKSVAFVFENPNFLNLTIACKSLLHKFLRQTVGDSSTIHGTVGWG